MTTRFPLQDISGSLDDEATRPEPDQIGLSSRMYKQLFGQTFNADAGGKPWRRGIVQVEHRPTGISKTQRVHLLYRGMSHTGLNTDTCILPGNAKQQLGIKDQGAIVQVRAAQPWIGRGLFFWNHPTHTTRVAFKLGAIALLISVFQLVRDFLQ